MTKAKRGRKRQPDPTEGLPANKANAEVHAIAGKSAGYALAGAENDPAIRHAAVCAAASRGFLTDGEASPGMGDRVDALSDAAMQIGGGYIDAIGKMLGAQAITCDLMFTQLLARAQNNLNQYPDAARSYMALAMKAQAQSRATLEAIAKMRQPREQVVRHVHVYEGGQALVADQFHNHGGGSRIAGFYAQPHRQSPFGPPMLGKDPAGFGVPVSSDAGQEAVPDSWGQVAGGTKG